MQHKICTSYSTLYNIYILSLVIWRLIDKNARFSLLTTRELLYWAELTIHLAIYSLLRLFNTISHFAISRIQIRFARSFSRMHYNLFMLNWGQLTSTTSFNLITSYCKYSRVWTNLSEIWFINKSYVNTWSIEKFTYMHSISIKKESNYIIIYFS